MPWSWSWSYIVAIDVCADFAMENVVIETDIVVLLDNAKITKMTRFSSII